METTYTKPQNEPAYNANLQTKEKITDEKENWFREHLEDFLKTLQGSYAVLR